MKRDEPLVRIILRCLMHHGEPLDAHRIAECTGLELQQVWATLGHRCYHGIVFRPAGSVPSKIGRGRTKNRTLWAAWEE